MTTEKQTTADRIVAVIAARPGIYPAAIAETLGMKPDAVYQAVHKLKKAGQVMKGDSGGLVIGKAATPAEKPARKSTEAKPRRAKVARKGKRKAYRRAKASRGNGAAPLAISPSILGHAVVGAQPVAAFTAKGEIVVTAPGGVKVLDTDETRQVVELVRAFDGAGLLPKAA